jgi:hypothetical protein
MMPRRLLQAPGSAALRGHGDIRFDVGSRLLRSNAGSSKEFDLRFLTQ